MGSLPNLHELDKDVKDQNVGFKPGPALGHLCGGCNGFLTTEEKSKILHRFSGHARIAKAVSNPHDSHKIVNCEDVIMEHVSTYSPISTKSRFNLPFHANTSARRRDSMSSSIGATSVRKLLAVVRGGNTNKINSSPIYTRRVLISNLVVLCMSNLLSTAAFLPFLTLQTSVSIWTKPVKNNIGVDVNIGSFIISVIYLIAAICAIIAPYVVKRIGSNLVIVSCYGIMTIFYLSHIYPHLYLIIPASMFMGASLGLLSGANITFLLTLSHRITGLFHYDDDDNRQARKTCIVRRVARAFQASNDFGLILGSILSAILINYTANLKNGTYITSYIDNGTIITDDCETNSTYNLPHCLNMTQPVIFSNVYDYNSFLDNIFDKTEDGRLCGSQACPFIYQNVPNQTVDPVLVNFRVLPVKSAEILVGVYAGCALAALFLGLLGLDKIKMSVYQDPMERGEIFEALRSTKDAFNDRKLQLAAPLAIFIGMEQALLYADFSKSYVVCTLGIHRLNLVFLTMGVLQSIAACTLSMLLRTIRRYYVVVVGFLFHSCLIMVLIVWKPTEDDPALFYVISAAWGVCNAIWDLLNFTFLTGLYVDNWDTSFANTYFYKFIGLALTFSMHSLVCNYCKLYFLALAMVISVIPFIWVEVKLENMRKGKNITRL